MIIAPRNHIGLPPKSTSLPRPTSSHESYPMTSARREADGDGGGRMGQAIPCSSANPRHALQCNETCEGGRSFGLQQARRGGPIRGYGRPHITYTNTALTQREFQLCLLPRQPPQHILILHISHLMSQHMELSLHTYNGSRRRSVGAEVVYTPAAGIVAAVVMPTTV